MFVFRKVEKNGVIHDCWLGKEYTQINKISSSDVFDDMVKCANTKKSQNAYTVVISEKGYNVWVHEGENCCIMTTDGKVFKEL